MNVKLTFLKILLKWGTLDQAYIFEPRLLRVSPQADGFVNLLTVFSAVFSSHDCETVIENPL